MPLKMQYQYQHYTLLFPINRTGIIKYAIRHEETMREWYGEIIVKESYIAAREPFERQIKQDAREVLKHRRRWKTK